MIGDVGDNIEAKMRLAAREVRCSRPLRRKVYRLDFGHAQRAVREHVLYLDARRVLAAHVREEAVGRMIRSPAAPLPIRAPSNLSK